MPPAYATPQNGAYSQPVQYPPTSAFVPGLSGNLMPHGAPTGVQMNGPVDESVKLKQGIITNVLKLASTPNRQQELELMINQLPPDILADIVILNMQNLSEIMEANVAGGVPPQNVMNGPMDGAARDNVPQAVNRNPRSKESTIVSSTVSAAANRRHQEELGLVGGSTAQTTTSPAALGHGLPTPSMKAVHRPSPKPERKVRNDEGLS